MSNRPNGCLDCHGTCPPGRCTDTRVAVRRVLVDHLTMANVREVSFGDLVLGILDDLTPHLKGQP